MRHIFLIIALFALLLPTACCGPETAPGIASAIPSQLAAIDVAIESIEAGEPGWTESSALLDLLRQDRLAWEELDRYFNGDTTPAPAPEDG